MKICFVTGCSGSLGQSLLNQLIKNDYFVVSVGRSKAELANQNIIVDFLNYNIIDVKNQIEKILKKLNQIDRIDFVHCAGVYYKETENDIKNKDNILLESFNINTFSFYRLVNILVEFNKALKVAGSYIAISSNLTTLKNKSTTAYISSKFALEGMVESFAQTYGEFNIRFNSICPGMFPSKLNNYIVPESFKNSAPLKRICDCDDISKLILFLLSDDSNCITAEKIVIDGGNSNGY